MVVDIFWVVVGGGRYILGGGGWWWIYFGWWWIVVGGGTVQSDPFSTNTNVVKRWEINCSYQASLIKVFHQHLQYKSSKYDHKDLSPSRILKSEKDISAVYMVLLETFISPTSVNIYRYTGKREDSSRFVKSVRDWKGSNEEIWTLISQCRSSIQ